MAVPALLCGQKNDQLEVVVMGIYRSICYFVEDIIVKFLGKKQSSDELKAKVKQYRITTEEQDLENSVF